MNTGCTPANKAYACTSPVAFVYCLNGHVAYLVAATVYALTPGDSLLLDATLLLVYLASGQATVAPHCHLSP